MLKPLGDRVVAMTEKAAEKTASGIFLPTENKEKSSVAIVESVGDKVANIKKGDKIVFREYASTDVKINGDKFLILKEEDILAKVEDK
ncbi:MAG: co-chaperone GroES [Candidatus Nanoperiomorbaceae bacterium]